MRHRPRVSDQFFASLNCTVSDTGSQLSVELPTLLASLPRQEGDGTAAGAAERTELFQIVYADHTAFDRVVENITVVRAAHSTDLSATGGHKGRHQLQR